MAHMKSGMVLREARERKGYELATVARRLRIRPDILRAIENNDFSLMPPRGYTRNMVNAYARLLGLNPTEIVNMYLDEAYAHQVERARDKASVGAFDMGRDSRRSPSRTSRRTSESEASYESHLGTRTRTALGRDLYDDRTEYARADYGLNRGNPSSNGRRTGYSDGDDFLSRSRGPRHSDHTAMRSNQYTNLYAGPKPANPLQSRLPFIIGGALLVVLLIVVLVLVFGNRSNAASDVSSLPVTGISDTTGADDASEEKAPAPVVEKAPTSAKVVYSVPTSGDEAYVEIYTDGEQTSADLLTGPVSNEVEVTGTWTITTWAVEALKVTVDGVEVTLVSDANYGGMYSYTVDYNAILTAWNQAHGVATASTEQGQSASASTSAAAGSASVAQSETDAGSSSNVQTGASR